MLLRALRDFNLGKLTADDTSIFMGLLGDLFPRTVELVPRAVDRDFEAKARLWGGGQQRHVAMQEEDGNGGGSIRCTPSQLFVSIRAAPVQVREAALELGYQPDPTFCLKVSQLREIFEVRWSVFLLGPAGCGKSAIWRTLMKAQNNFGEKTVRGVRIRVWLMRMGLQQHHRAGLSPTPPAG